MLQWHKLPCVYLKPIIGPPCAHSIQHILETVAAKNYPLAKSTRLWKDISFLKYAWGNYPEEVFRLINHTYILEYTFWTHPALTGARTANLLQRSFKIIKISILIDLEPFQIYVFENYIISIRYHPG